MICINTDRYEIQLFREFDISINNQSILHHTQYSATIELLAFLLANHGQKLTSREILESVYVAGSFTDGRKTLSVYMCRLFRSIYSSNALHPKLADMITLEKVDGAYLLSVSKSCSFDIRDFEVKEEQLRCAEETAAVADDIRNFCNQYLGKLLSDMVYNPWAVKLRKKFDDKLFKLAHKMLKIRFDTNQYNDAIMDASDILNQNPLDELTNIYLIKALLHEKRFNDAMEHYSVFTMVLYTNLNHPLRDEFKELYQEIKLGLNVQTNSVDVIKHNEVLSLLGSHSYQSHPDTLIGLIRTQGEASEEAIFATKETISSLYGNNCTIYTEDRAIFIIMQNIQEDDADTLSELINNCLHFKYPLIYEKIVIGVPQFNPRPIKRDAKH